MSKDELGWNGSHRPRPPSEGFATTIGVGIASNGPKSPPTKRRGPTAIGGSGTRLDVTVMDQPGEGPSLTPAGRIPFK